MSGAVILVVFTLGVLALVARPPKSKAYGSAGWTLPRCERDLVTSSYNLPGGAVFLSRSHRSFVALPREQALQHGVIVGGSGTGKSRGYFLPNAAFSRDTSIVATDPKGELWRITSGFHRDTERFAPAEPDASTCFNWIPLCRDSRISELCARSIVESGNVSHTEQAWLDMETAFLAALFSHTSTLTEPTPLTAYRLFTRQSQSTLLKQLLGSESEAAQEEAVIFQQTQERMRGSIVPVIASKLQFMKDDAVARFTSATYDPPTFGGLRKNARALYWCLREQDIARLRPLTSLFFSLLLEQIASAEISDREVSVPILCLLDEFANVGVIPNFETTISLARGRGVAIWLGIQSLSQLEARYGTANAQTILTNCATKVALSGLDVRTAEYFSKALGDGTVVTRKRALHSQPLPTGTTHTRTEHGRPLLTPDEVRRIRTDKAIVIAGNRRPMLLPKYFYDESARTAKTTILGPARALVIPIQAAVSNDDPPPIPDDLMYLSITTSEVL